MSITEKTPPPNFVEKCAEMNKDWLVHGDCQVEPYLDTGDYGDDWKIRLVKRHGQEVVLDHIRLEGVDGHTLMLFVDKLRRQRIVSEDEGRMMAIARLTNSMCDQVGVDPRKFKQFYVPTIKS